MKTFPSGLALSLSLCTSGLQAQQTVIVEGQEFELSALMADCQSIPNNPAAQVACFSALTRMLDEQTSASPGVGVSTADAFADLQAAAQYRDDDTGLMVSGADCNVKFTYFANYFHISRRNISSVDLFSAAFDASKLQLDQVDRSQAANAFFTNGAMVEGEKAVTRGGVNLESAQYDFEPRAPGMSLDVYASDVVDQLAGAESQTFDFVLVHPQRSTASDEIWDAFKTLVAACQS